MWFRQKPNATTGTDLRLETADLRDIPPPPRPPKPLMDSEQFVHTVVPDIERLWSARCFCHGPQFLKLVGFDFRDYGIGPASLVDTNGIISRIILKNFEALSPWRQDPDGGRRMFRCPQCKTHFEVWSEEYSIAMSVLSAKPCEPAPRAETGHYAASFHYFAGQAHELAQITDYRPAESVADYLKELTAPG